jgi:hypothetical protein
MENKANDLYPSHKNSVERPRGFKCAPRAIQLKEKKVLQGKRGKSLKATASTSRL